MSNISHRVKAHKSGMKLADKISAVFLVGIVGTLMVGPIVYSIQRDHNALKNYPIVVQIEK